MCIFSFFFSFCSLALWGWLAFRVVQPPTRAKPPKPPSFFFSFFFCSLSLWGWPNQSHRQRGWFGHPKGSNPLNFFFWGGPCGSGQSVWGGETHPQTKWRWSNHPQGFLGVVLSTPIFSLRVAKSSPRPIWVAKPPPKALGVSWPPPISL
jgi:hypothetical protein